LARRQAIGDVEREVANAHRTAAEAVVKGTQGADEHRVRLELVEITLDLLFARLADARWRDADEGRSLGAQGAKRFARARQLQKVEIDARRTRRERGPRLLFRSAEHEEAGGRCFEILGWRRLLEQP